ncbi:MAG: hypothetical protein HC875_00735 [Anaerolineales bacterium]|nr:hypothetical protein [Anaerolineales bacterium]
MDGRVITLELSEHDALQLLRLVEKELKRADKTWRPYWETQLNRIEQFIDQASQLQSSVWPEDIFTWDDNGPAPGELLKLEGSY